MAYAEFSSSFSTSVITLFSVGSTKADYYAFTNLLGVVLSCTQMCVWHRPCPAPVMPLQCFQRRLYTPTRSYIAAARVIYPWQRFCSPRKHTNL